MKICQECSSDILNARFKFYVITLILSSLIFFLLLYSVHLALKPRFCLGESQALCGSIKQTVNSLNPYRKNAPAANLEHASHSLHMFSQMGDANVDDAADD